MYCNCTGEARLIFGYEARKTTLDLVGRLKTDNLSKLESRDVVLKSSNGVFNTEKLKVWLEDLFTIEKNLLGDMHVNTVMRNGDYKKGCFGVVIASDFEMRDILTVVEPKKLESKMSSLYPDLMEFRKKYKLQTINDSPLLYLCAYADT